MYSSNNRLVYVVDDDVSTCNALSLLLKTYGFRVETFSNPENFLNFKHPKTPSCVLLDMRLPKVNGFGVQETMKNKEINIPVIFISGYGTISDTVKAIRGGAIEFLEKPVCPTKLLESISLAMA